MMVKAGRRTCIKLPSGELEADCERRMNVLDGIALYSLRTKIKKKEEY